MDVAPLAEVQIVDQRNTGGKQVVAILTSRFCLQNCDLKGGEELRTSKIWKLYLFMLSIHWCTYVTLPRTTYVTPKSTRCVLRCSLLVACDLSLLARLLYVGIASQAFAAQYHSL